MKLKLDDTNYGTLAGLIGWLRREYDHRLYAIYTLGVKNQLHKDQDVKYSIGKWFNPEPTVVTWEHIIDMKELYNQSKGFLVDDVLIVEAHIEWMFASKDIIVDGMKVGEEEN
ncbi:ubiquitin C-terminal hydrolase 12-like [Apium graveolens]|uniref:ubiquitin C-terminal hydrolase 12-like n=1 Tax=Apium graveolens TaxID=4045 RepID=UPI003D791F8D